MGGTVTDVLVSTASCADIVKNIVKGVRSLQKQCLRSGPQTLVREQCCSIGKYPTFSYEVNERLLCLPSALRKRRQNPMLQETRYQASTYVIPFFLEDTYFDIEAVSKREIIMKHSPPQSVCPPVGGSSEWYYKGIGLAHLGNRRRGDSHLLCSHAAHFLPIIAATD